IKLSHMRKNIGMVLQEPFLFSRTIRENVSAAQPGADLSEVRRATSIASVDDAISSMTEGYDTVVGERGVTLSGGQKQRVAIARMLMQKAPVMIFDDSLSAVDSETDAKIRQALNENLGGSTVILISHRITTLMNADCILVLSGGEIAQIGTHKELIRQPGIYQDIYNIQTAQDDQALLAKEEV
ncbi:MAG: ATP-binding cassette domain-containing protein, partial [Oscillospiraceae bacterium]|nr:ATP-binding cassette domain-containing protein [Oscillospiraceae bacterium]